MKILTSSFSLALVLLLATPSISMAQQQSPAKKGNPASLRETPGDAYSPNQFRNKKTSPAYRRAGSQYFTTQANVNDLGENIIGDAANEPSIAIDPTNPARMLIAWRQFDDVTNNFRQAGYAYTTDAGLTWTFPGVITPGVFRSDPVLGTDSEGTFYYNSLTVDDANNYTCNIFRNNYGEFTWDEGTYAHGGDKQWMIIDKTGGPSDGHNYSFWNDMYSSCWDGSSTRSVNKGNSYEDCEPVDGNPYWGTLAVGPEGELYAVGNDNMDGIIVTKSTTARDPEQTVSWDFTSTVDLDGSMQGWTELNPAGLLGQAYIDVDCSDGPGKGNVYVLASVQRTNYTDPADVMFSKSTDGGLTWDPPKKINDDESIENFQWFGTMSVAPNGRIDAVWLDTRDSPASVYMSALYYSYSLDQGETWSANEQLSDYFDSHIGWPNQQKMGDYYHMLSDNSGAHLAWANTLNGEQDVYYTHIILYDGTAKITSNRDLLSLSCSPNPAHGKTTIRYILPDQCNTRLVICDLYGKEIRTLVNAEQSAGPRQIDFNTDELPAGYYFCRLQAGANTATKSIIKIR